MGLVQKSFSDIITFSRSSNATRVGPTGVLEYAPHNLLTYSEQFDNAAWITNNATITANSAASPSGSVTADKITEDSNNTDHKTRQTFTFAGVTQTYSCYLKAAERTCGALQIYDGATLFGYIFDLTNGVLGSRVAGSSSNVTGTIVSVGNGWFKCSITCTPAAGSGQVNIAVALNTTTISYTGDGTSGVYIWGAQLSVGPYALDYTPTTSAAVYGPRFDYDGSGVTIVEPVSTNLVTYSEQFDNAAWTTANISVTANSATAPDGTVTADTLTGTGSGYTSIYRTETVVSGSSYTLSIYAKANVTSLLSLEFRGSGSSPDAIFNLSNGTVSSGTGVISSAGNGWYRCSITKTAVDASEIIIVGFNGGSSNVGDSIFVWGAQLEVGSTATGYMVSGATNGFRAVPVVSGSATPKGLLVEEQRTNLALYSEDFSNAAWTKTRSSITANAIAAPDGTVTADKLVEDTTASNTHFIVQGIAMGGSVDSSRFAFGIFAKAGERSRIRMFDNNQNSSGDTTFNLSTGTVVTGSGTITNVGNGWYRCTIYPLKDFSTTSTVRIEIDNGSTTSYTGDGTSGLFLWGAQLEAGSFATSYIPTPTNSAVTRTADVASVNTLSPWWNNSEGSFYFEGDLALASGKYPGLYKTGTTNGQRVGQFMNQGTTSATSFFYRVSDSVTSGSINNQSVFKLASAYSGSELATALNGGVAATASASGSLTLPTILYLGYFDEYMSGHIRRLAYYPRKLSNAEIQALTS